MSKKLLWGVLFMVMIIISGVNTGCDRLSSSILKSRSVPTVVDMRASLFAGYPYLEVYLNPKNAKAGELYIIDLYDKADGMFRERKNITFTQPQVNVGTIQKLIFSLTDEERNAYAWLTDAIWWKSCFIVRINEPIPEESIRKPIMSPSITPTTNHPIKSPTQIIANQSITLLSPNGGEIWHIGDVETITWTSKNMDSGTQIQITLSDENGVMRSDMVDNTGVFKWTVTEEATSHAKIKITSLSNISISAISNNDFTISAK